VPPDVYVAPARYPLTVLHRLDPDREADLFGQEERIDGWTICGRPFRESELWMPVEGRDGDLLCTGCMLPGGAEGAAEDAAGVLF
jgi:hypothetical protein